MRLTTGPIELLDEEGNVVWSIAPLEIEVDPPSPRAPLKGRTATSRATATSTSKSKDSVEISPAVESIWAYWIEKREPLRKGLEPSQAKMIAKGLELVDEAGLRAAIDGLLASEWHREHKRLQLSTILATKPGGPTLGDQIESFMEKSPRIDEKISTTVAANGRLSKLRHELSVYEKLSEEQLRPGDYTTIAELRAEIAEMVA